MHFKSILRSRMSRNAWMLVLLFMAQAVQAQTFTLTVQKTSLEKVFHQIEQLSDYRFIYTEELLSQSLPVSFSVKNVALDSVLQICFRQQPITYITEGKHIIIRKRTMESSGPPGRVLRGRVVTDAGEPVAGVTVSIRNTRLITSTDGNGEFVFQNAPVSAILLISGAEFDMQEFSAGTQPYVLVNVKPKTNLLDETIIIAYGKATRKDLTGTVSKVSKQDLSNQPVNNVLAGMQGRVTGLQITQQSGLPGSNFIVRLRGQNSIANGNDPLYIIDGVPYPAITLTSSLGGGGGALTSPLAAVNPNDIESVEILKDADATAIYGSRGANGVILITTKKAQEGMTSVEAKVYTGWGKVTRFLPMLGLQDYLNMRREAFRNDGTMPTVSNARDLMLWDTTRYTDWQNLLIGNTMHVTDMNVGVRGGNGLNNFYINGGYHKESTIIPGPFAEEKISIGFNANHQSLNRRFKIAFSGSFLKNNTLLPREDITSQISLSPNAPAIYTNDGRYNWENSTWVNPMALLERKYRTNTNNLLSNLTLSYNFIKGLEAKINVGYSLLSMREHSTTPGISQDQGLNYNISAGFGSNQVETFIAEPQLSYRFFLGKGKIQLLGGATVQGTDQKSLVQSGNGYQSDDLLKTLQGAATVTTFLDYQSKYRYAGVFARIAYDWQSKYLFTLNARRDGSSRYGPANRFANFGSVGAGWIFSKEKFFSNLKWLSFGKIKVSTGVTGNDQIGDYKFLDIYSPYTYTYQGISTLNPVQLYNPYYNWEKVIKREASIELGFFKDRIFFTVNHYNNLTKNQLVNYPLPAVSGFQGILRNIPARIRNYGWEFELNGNIVQQKHFNWTTKLSLTIPRNRLLEFQGLERSSYANSYVIGEPLTILKRLTYMGVDSLTGNYTFMDANQDGRISSPADQNTIVFTGQQFFGGLENTLRYKQIRFGFFAQFVKIKNAQSFAERFGRPGILSNMPDYVLERWQYPGHVTDVQKFANSNSQSNTAFTNFRVSDHALVDGSYFRVKNVYISYDLPAKTLQKILLKAATFFIQAQNLITFTPYKGLDPETRAVVPPLKMITAGLQITF